MTSPQSLENPIVLAALRENIGGLQSGNYDPSSIYQLETRGEGAIGLSVRSAADQKTRSARVPFAGDFLRRRERFWQIYAARSDRRGRQIGHGRRRRRRARRDAGECARLGEAVEVLLAEQDSSRVFSARRGLLQLRAAVANDDERTKGDRRWFGRCGSGRGARAATGVDRAVRREPRRQ